MLPETGLYKRRRSGQFRGHPFLLGSRAPRLSFVPFSSAVAFAFGAGHVSARSHPEACPLCLHRLDPSLASAQSTRHRSSRNGAGRAGVRGNKETREKEGSRGAAARLRDCPGGRATARPTAGFRGRPFPGRATTAPRNHREARVPRAAAGGQVRRQPPGVPGAPAGGGMARRPHVARASEAIPAAGGWAGACSVGSVGWQVEARADEFKKIQVIKN